MCGDRKQIDVLSLNIDGNLSCRLRRVSVESHVLLPAKLSNFRNWLQDAGLIVSSHNRDQDCFVIYGPL